MSAAAQSVAPPRPVAAQVARPAQKPSAWDNLKPLIPYVARYKGMVALGLLTLALMGLVGALPQLISGLIIDLLKGSPVPLPTLSGTPRAALRPLFSLYAARSSHALILYSIWLVGAVLVKGFLSFWTRWILIGVSREIEYDLRNDLLARLLLLEPQFFLRNRTGDLMSRATNDLNAVRMVLGPGIMYSATTVATMVLAIFFMLRLSPGLTLWVLLPVPIVAVAVRYFGQIIHRLSEKIQAALGVLSTSAQENLSGVRVVRAYRQEQSEIEIFDRANRDYVASNIRLISTWSMFFPGLQAMIGLAFLILLWQGGRQVMDHRITLGTLWAFNTFLFQLAWPMVALGWVTNIFQRGAASMGRLSYILTAEAEINDSAVPAHWKKADGAAGPDGSARRASPGATIRGDIEFRNLTFTFPTATNGSDSIPVLRDINLHIPAGATVALVGPTGCGKSTLAALIARLWEAPPGTLFLDGRPISEYPLAVLRRSIGYVPQDTFLFSDTIRENIAFGVRDASERQILEAAEIASIAAEIQSFPEKLDTPVGERGLTLSGGQKQRTALARAILRDPKILILDDSLSSVDTDTEEKILRRLKELMHQRTTVLISHRCSTVKDADQIVVLREGRIVERGAHDDLLARGGYYADLYQKQLLEEELARE